MKNMVLRCGHIDNPNGRSPATHRRYHTVEQALSAFTFCTKLFCFDFISVFVVLWYLYVVVVEDQSLVNDGNPAA